MDSKNAYEEVLDLLPEKSVRELCDDLSNARFEDETYQRLHKLLERAKDASFYFDIPKLDGAFRMLVATTQELYDFLPTHSSMPVMSSALSLYPECEYDESVYFPENGESKTKREIVDEALGISRQLKSDLGIFISAYQNKDEVISGENTDLVWEELLFENETGDLFFRGEKCHFRLKSNGYWLIYLMFEDSTKKSVEKDEVYATIKGISIDDSPPETVSAFFKNILNGVNAKIQKELHTNTQLFSQDGDAIKRNI